ncbi:MAG: LacI family DNA-binding transcriptional regulator [Deinococcales bacterium]
MLEKKRVTRQAVAKYAGVSTATVSYVLNGLGDANHISAETQNRVREAISTLNYVRNVSARRLAMGKTHVISIVTDNKSVNYPINATLHRIQQGVSEVCAKRGYHSMVHGVYDNHWNLIKEDLALSHRVDGIIVINPPSEHQVIQELMEDNFPIVTLGSARAPHSYSVNIDNFNSARIATQHLIDKGHQRIAHISYSEPDLTDVVERMAGYQIAIKEANLEPYRLIRHAEYSFGSAFAIMNELLSLKDRPSAIFAGNDITAIGCMSAIRKRGFSIPEDIAIVGFDDIPISAYLSPPLTTIQLDGEKQGTLAANILLDLIESRTPEQKTILLESPLILRDST